MDLHVNKTLGLRGEAVPPSSKSQSIRGLLFALLTKGTSKFCNILDSDDTQTAMQVCTALGAKINLRHNLLTVYSQGVPLNTCPTAINTGNSGITTRFILPLLGLRQNYNIPVILDCGEQMRERPIDSLVCALRNLGMNIQYVTQDGRLPIAVTGQLQGGVTTVEGITSQYLSALLIGLPCAENASLITVKNLHERPYINMTLAWLQQQGIAYKHWSSANMDIFKIIGNQQYKSMQTTIQGDFSSASCLIAAATLLPGTVELYGLNRSDLQGDQRLISILQDLGAEITVTQDKIRIIGNRPLIGSRIDANDIPDLLPALAVIATFARGKTEIYNVKQARLKETDRIHSMTEGLRKMGARIAEHPDGMIVYPSNLHGALVSGFGDHRTVMALTVAGMIADGTTIITDGEAINKTYPRFVETIQALGGRVSFIRELLSS